MNEKKIEMKEIKYTILYCAFVRYYGSGTVISYGSSSNFLTSYGSGFGSTRQKVTVPTFRFQFHNTLIMAWITGYNYVQGPECSSGMGKQPPLQVTIITSILTIATFFARSTLSWEWEEDEYCVHVTFPCFSFTGSVSLGAAGPRVQPLHPSRRILAP